MTERWTWGAGLLLGAWLLLGCATLVKVDGFELSEDSWTDDRRNLLARATFDLSCPQEQVVLKVLTELGGEYAGSVGATGCGKKATYVRVPYTTTWALDAVSDAP